MKTVCTRLDNDRGITLIELMIAVAIVGILAAIGTVAFNKYMNKGKVTKLETWAMEVAKGQEQYKSRNSTYYPGDGTLLDTDTGDPQIWGGLLEFDKTLPQGVLVETQSGTAGQNCTICDGGVTPDTTSMWYAVRVTQDLDGDAGTGPTTVIVHNDLESTVVLSEGL